MASAKDLDKIKLEIAEQSSDNKAESSEAQAASESGVVIDSINKLAAFCLSDNRFSEFHIVKLNENLLSLNKGSCHLLVMSPLVYMDENKFCALKSWQDFDKSAIILLPDNVTQPQNLAETPEYIDSEIVQFIPPGANQSFVATILLNVNRLQTNLYKYLSEQAQANRDSEEVKTVLRISRELNGERNIEKLLNIILKKAREVTNADAGSIYILEKPSRNVNTWKIHFKFTQNDSVKFNLSRFSMNVNKNSIVGNVVLSKKPINIPDLYTLDEDPNSNPFGVRHDKSWDQRTGYESHSMLSVPLYDISHEVTGVIQLINRKKNPNKVLQSKDDFAAVMPFSEKDIEFALIVGQQAGIALENASMTEEIQSLFDGFVNAAVTAIEQRDPTTSGHSHRVANLTIELAKTVDFLSDGPMASISFDEDQFKEIRYASLLHDFGKLGVSEKVLVKAKKLYPWELDQVESRFQYIRAMHEINYYKKYVEYLENKDSYPSDFIPEQLRADLQKNIGELQSFYDIIRSSNEPTILEEGSFEKLHEIASKTYRDIEGNTNSYLLSEELGALSVSKGSLTREEFLEIQSHVTHTYNFLRMIPWGSKLSEVPNIAAKHHEYLNGTGYPHGASAPQIQIQTRMMTIADIFDALTAADRPYKKALPAEKALDILNMEMDRGKVDGDLLKIFIEAKIFNLIHR